MTSLPPFLFESMQSKDASGHFVSTIPAATHPSPTLPRRPPRSAVLHCHTSHFLTLPTGCSFLPPASVLSTCSCSPLLWLLPCTYTRASLGGHDGIALHQVLCKNRSQSNTGSSLRNSAPKPQSTLQGLPSNRRRNSSEETLGFKEV